MKNSYAIREDSPTRLITFYTNLIIMVWPILWLSAQPFSLAFFRKYFGLVSDFFQASAQMPPRGT
jgi:hypothetical protein